MALQPLHLDGLADNHCHCDYSIDATGTIREYCDAALERGLAEVCFTTHFDANPNGDGKVNFVAIKGKRVPTTIDNLAPYVEDVLAAREEYLPLGISVKLGVEFGWYTGCEEQVVRLKERYPLEYVLCGIHELENLPFCCSGSYQDCFGKYSAEKMTELYFRETVAAIRTNLFDGLAHLEYYRKFGESFYGTVLETTPLPFLEDLFDALRESRTVLEVNTAAVRKGLREYYPRAEIVHRARRAGVAVAHLGSDAHKPDQVGFDFEVAAALVPNVVGGCDD